MLFSSADDAVFVNDHSTDCLMYADDIVILLYSEKSLQNQIDTFKTVCHKWSLDFHLTKTKVIFFNKSGKFLEQNCK